MSRQGLRQVTAYLPNDSRGDVIRAALNVLTREDPDKSTSAILLSMIELSIMQEDEDFMEKVLKEIKVINEK